MPAEAGPRQTTTNSNENHHSPLSRESTATNTDLQKVAIPKTPSAKLSTTDQTFPKSPYKSHPMIDANSTRGYEIYDRIKDDLIPNHEFDMIFIDCVSGDYVVQGKSETRSDAETRLLARHPGAEIFMEQIVKDDFAYSLPNVNIAPSGNGN